MNTSALNDLSNAGYDTLFDQTGMSGLYLSLQHALDEAIISSFRASPANIDIQVGTFTDFIGDALPDGPSAIMMILAGNVTNRHLLLPAELACAIV
jgi:hypothetical protein